MTATEKKLNALRTEIFSLVMSRQEPSSVGFIVKEFDESFGYEIPCHEVGYPNVRSLLIDHPKLIHMYMDGKDMFKAKFDETTGDIQCMVARQRKKKKGGKKRSNFQRSNQTRSFYGGNPPPRNYGADTRSSLRNPNRGSRRSGGGGGKQTSSNFSFGPAPGFELGGGSWYANAAPSQPSTTTGRTASYKVPANYSFKASSQFSAPTQPDASAGVKRVMTAMKRVNGSATLTRLNHAYKLCFGVQFDGAEMKKYFGTSNLRRIFQDHFADKVKLLEMGEKQYMFVSEELVQARKEFEQQYEQRHTIEIVPQTRSCTVPKIGECYDMLTRLLVDLHPTTVPVSEIGLYLTRAERVEEFNPMDAFGKGWLDLVRSTFKDRIELQDDCIRLTAAYVKRANVTQKVKKEVKSANAVVAVTADGLGFDTSEDSDDESDEESDDDSASTASSCANKTSSSALPPSSSNADLSSRMLPSVSLGAPLTVPVGTPTEKPSIFTRLVQMRNKMAETASPSKESPAPVVDKLDFKICYFESPAPVVDKLDRFRRLCPSRTSAGSLSPVDVPDCAPKRNGEHVVDSVTPVKQPVSEAVSTPSSRTRLIFSRLKIFNIRKSAQEKTKADDDVFLKASVKPSGSASVIGRVPEKSDAARTGQ